LVLPAEGLLTEAGEAVAGLRADDAANVGLFVDVKVEVGLVERVQEAQQFRIFDLVLENSLNLLAQVQFLRVAPVERVFFEDVKKSLLKELDL
jgi:hypothetical protein